MWRKIISQEFFVSLRKSYQQFLHGGEYRHEQRVFQNFYKKVENANRAKKDLEGTLQEKVQSPPNTTKNINLQPPTTQSNEIISNLQKMEDEYYKGYGKSSAEFSHRINLIITGSIFGSIVTFIFSNLKTEEEESKKLQIISKRLVEAKGTEIELLSLFGGLQSRINCIEDLNSNIISDTQRISEKMGIQRVILENLKNDLFTVQDRHTGIFKFFYSYTRPQGSYFGPSFVSTQIHDCCELIKAYDAKLYFIDLLVDIFSNNYDLALKKSRKKMIELLDVEENKNLILTLKEKENEFPKSHMAVLLLEAISFIYLVYPNQSDHMYNVFSGELEKIQDGMLLTKKYEKNLEFEKIYSNVIQFKDKKNNIPSIIEYSISLFHNIGYSYMKLGEIQSDDNERKKYFEKSDFYLSQIVRGNSDKPRHTSFSFMPFYSYAYLNELNGDLEEAIKYYKVAILFKENDNDFLKEKVEDLKKLKAGNVVKNPLKVDFGYQENPCFLLLFKQSNGLGQISSIAGFNQSQLFDKAMPQEKKITSNNYKK